MQEAAHPALMTFREDFIDTCGFRIKYLELGQGAPVVILSCIMWEISKLRDALARMYRVVVLELPGFGSSPVNNDSSSTKDLANIVAQATEIIVPEKYTLIGTSFGANVALWQTLQAPEQVEALVLISPTALHPRGDLATDNPMEMAKQLLAHPENSPGISNIDPDIIAREHELVRRLGGGTHDAEMEARLSQIQCPALVMFGSQDQLVATEAASIYRREIPNSNVSIVYDAGHLIGAERPEALVNAVVDYVERRETFIVSRESRIINP